MHRKTHYNNIPIKPQRVYKEINQPLPHDTVYVSNIDLNQIAAKQLHNIYDPRQWINSG